MRPHGPLFDGAHSGGTVANVHPPLPGYRKSVVVKVV
jgi:hypothetical protein